MACLNLSFGSLMPTRRLWLPELLTVYPQFPSCFFMSHASTYLSVHLCGNMLQSSGFCSHCPTELNCYLSFCPSSFCSFFKAHHKCHLLCEVCPGTSWLVSSRFLQILILPHYSNYQTAMLFVLRLSAHTLKPDCLDSNPSYTIDQLCTLGQGFYLQFSAM